MLLFGVQGRLYAVDLATVREIVPIGRYARLAGAPAHVLGVVNVRGTIVTTVDLGSGWGGAPWTALKARSCCWNTAARCWAWRSTKSAMC